MTTVRERALSGDHRGAVAQLATLPEPAATDLAWAGQAYLVLGQPAQAELTLRRALQAESQLAAPGNRVGAALARVFLTLLHLQRHEVAQARASIDRALEWLGAGGPQAEEGSVAPGGHSGAEYSEALAAAWREEMRVRVAEGQGRERVLEAGQRAWQASALAGTAIQVAVAQSVAQLWVYYQEPGAALPYLEFAREHARPDQRDFVQLSLAQALYTLGHPEEARAEWLGLLDGGTQPACRLHAELLEAAYERQRGDPAGALRRLRRLETEQSGQPHGELVVLKALLDWHLAADATGLAATLARARRLPAREFDQWALDYAEGFAAARQGDPGGVATLQAVASAQEAAGEHAQALDTLLALAETDLPWRPAHLARAAELAASLPGSLRRASLVPAHYALFPGVLAELRARPESDPWRSTLLTEEPGAGPGGAPDYRLVTLGEGTLRRAGGEAVRLRMSRTPEILAYLLERGPCELPTLLGDLFAEVPAPRAQNYFHQLRSDLAGRVPGLSIHFDRQTRRYSLRSPGGLAWDLAELRARLARGAPLRGEALAPFLPQAESEWAAQQREELLREWLRQGSEEVRALTAPEPAAALALAETLLALDPLSPPLLALFVNAEAAAHGPLSAAQRLRQAEGLCLREWGEVPAELRELAGRWPAR